MKRLLTILLIMTLLLVGCQTNQASTSITFTDDLGREVTIPATIERVAPSGNPAQILLYSLAPDKMVGWATRPREDQLKYIGEKYQSLPEFGAFYGKRGNLNVEALLAAKPQLVIDFGEKKKNITEQLDQLQEKTGVPIIFIEGDIDTMGQAYRRLGEVLDRSERAEQLAAFCEETINYANTKREQVKTALGVYLADGDMAGYNAIAASSIHARVIQLVGAVNVVDIEKTQGSGGNLISAEQLLNWQPDIVLINRAKAFDSVKQDETFQSLNAPIKLVPNALYNWMGRPPSINQLMGIYWLGNLLYPDIYDADVRDKAKQFYTLFFNYQLSDEELDALLN